MLVGSIDVGTRNLALAVYNSDTHAIIHVEVIDLSRVSVRGMVKIGEQSLVFLVTKMIEDRREIFSRCTIVGIEKQMTRRMLAVQFILEAVLTPLVPYVVQVVPSNVKRWLGTGCRRNHKKNKRAAIAKLKELIGPEGSARLAKFKKKDDVADSSLQAMYIHANLKKVLAKWNLARKEIEIVPR